jgi:CHAT domain-containing protein
MQHFFRLKKIKLYNTVLPFVLFITVTISNISVLKAQTFLDLNKQFITLYDSGKYDSAVLVGEKALIQCEVEYGKDNINYAISLENIADAYTALKKNKQAIEYYLRAIETYFIIKKTYEDFEIAFLRNKIGILYFNDKEFELALDYFSQSINYFYNHTTNNYESLYNISLNITNCCLNTGNYTLLYETANKILPFIEANKGKQTEEYYEMFYYLGFAHFSLENYTQAETIYKDILQLAEVLYGKNNIEYATVLKYYFRILNKQNKWVEAEKQLTEILQILEKITVDDIQDNAAFYEEAGNFYASIGKYNKATKCFKLAINFLESVGQKETDLYHSILHSSAYSNYQEGKLIEAKSLLDNLLKVYTKKYGRETEINVETLIILAGAETQLNYLSAAKEHIQEGYTLAIKFFGKEHQIIANVKETMGMIWNKTGESQKSIDSYKEGIGLLEKLILTNPDVSLKRLLASLNSNLGITYIEMGLYAEAENCLNTSLDIREKIIGKTHPEYALSLTNLAMVHLFQARYDKADKLLTDALKIYLDNGLVYTTNFFNIINNIALLAEKTNDAENAKLLYLRVLNILKTQNYSNTSTYSIIYGNLATLCFNQRKYDEVINYCNNSIKYLQQGNNLNSKDYIKVLNTLFLAYKNKKNFDEASKLANELLQLTIKVMGNHAELTGIVYNNIAMLYEEQNNVDKAANYLNEGNNILLKNFKQNFYSLSENEKLIWWNNQSFIFNLFPSLLKQFDIKEGKWVEALVNRQLQLKGLILTDSRNILNQVRNSNNASLKKLLDEWQYTKDLLSKLYSQPVAEQMYSLDSLEQKANKIEKEMNQISAGAVQLSSKTYTWQEIQQQLQPNEAAVEFISFPFYRNNTYTDTIQYAALIISKTKTPQFVLLTNETKLQYFMQGKSTDSKEVNIHRLYRSRLVKSSNTFFGDSIYHFIWKPIFNNLNNTTTISYAPDGLLHKLAFNALPIDSNRILIDKYKLQHYSSIMQIAERNTQHKLKWQSAFVIGNVNFNEAKLQNGTSIIYKDNSASWAPLAGTATEMSDIEKLMKTQQVKVTTVNGVNATEEAFKALNNKPYQIVHIATHGYFLNEISNNSTVNNLMRGEQLISISENPLLRSGLILAGANKAWSGSVMPKDVDDGILSAYEISRLNLTNTQLVVLSACETALGDINGTEGVFGLQRAFKIAGVKNLIVSLWQVPDKETAELMHLFYTHLFKGNSVRNAFYAAQKEMRAKYAPFLWAAFVLIE